MATSCRVNCTLHGDGVAATSNYPYIWVGFDIYFDRDATDKSKINWYTSGIPDNISLPSSGRYGYQFAAYIAINPADPNNPTWDELWTIVEKDNITSSYWWDPSITWRADRSGSFTCTATTATVYVYVKARYGSYECCMNSYGGWCYQNGHEYYLVDSFPTDLPPYETFYTVSYTMNGGTPQIASQQKSSLSTLKLSTITPTLPVSIVYHNSPNQTVTANRQFTGWRCSADQNIYSVGGNYSLNQACTMSAQWGNATFTPIAIPNQYFTVTFNYNGGTGTPATKSLLRPTNGYATSSGSTTKAYTPGVPATTTTNLNLYPIYQNPTLAYSSLPTATRNGYAFKGWYLNGTKVTGDISVTGNITLVANWQPLPIHKRLSNGTWDNNDRVYKWNGSAWVKVPAYKSNGTNWTNISQ